MAKDFKVGDHVVHRGRYRGQIMAITKDVEGRLSATMNLGGSLDAPLDELEIGSPSIREMAVKCGFAVRHDQGGYFGYYTCNEEQLAAFAREVQLFKIKTEES